MGEDKGGGEDVFPFPPPLTPPTRGGENKDAIHPRLKTRGILAYSHKELNKGERNNMPTLVKNYFYEEDDRV